MEEGTTPTPTEKPTRTKPPVFSFYAHLAATEARRFRRELTPENVASFAKTLLWVVPLTLLIWVYAATETEESIKDVSVPIDVKSADPGRIVSIPSSEKVLLCDLKGPRKSLESALLRLRQPQNAVQFSLDGSVPLGDDSSVPTLQTIENDSVFRDSGIVVEKCTPETLHVSVDRLGEVDAQVIAPANLLSLQSATFVPPTVKLRGPEKELAALGKNPVVMADIARLPVLNIPGQSPPQTVTLLPLDRTVDPNGNISVATGTVQATLQVKDADQTLDLTNLVIEPLMSQDLFSQYDLHFKDDQKLLPHLSVVGPPEQINRLKSKEIKPVAVLRIDSDDSLKTGGPQTVPLEIFGLPEGVRLATGASPQVTFTATPKAQ
jgi:hypothetical protein